jgi:hypothetical protein
MSRMPSCSGTAKFISRCERHRHEEDHDGAVRRKIWSKCSGGRYPGRRPAGLLGAHHDRIREAAQQHEQRQHDIRDTDALMVDGREPLAPR